MDINKENTIIVRDSAPKDLTEYVEADHDETPMSEKYKFHQSIGITQIKGHMIEAMHRPGSMTSFRQDGKFRRNLGRCQADWQTGCTYSIC